MIKLLFFNIWAQKESRQFSIQSKMTKLPATPIKFHEFSVMNFVDQILGGVPGKTEPHHLTSFERE